MARGKKTRDEDIEKVITAKLLDPQKSLRDIQEETGINHATCWDILETIPELLTSSSNGDKLIETMSWIIDDIAEITRFSIIAYKTKAREETLGINDLKGLNEIAKNNFDRKQILTGKNTVIIGWEWEASKKEFYDTLKVKVNDMNAEEVNNILQDLLK